MQETERAGRTVTPLNDRTLRQRGEQSVTAGWRYVAGCVGGNQPVSTAYV